MSVMIQGNKIESMKLNGHRVVEGMLNGQILFKYEETPYMSFQIQTADNDTFKVPFAYGNYSTFLPNISIVWGDGNLTAITDGNITETLCTHKYTKAGLYDVFIYSYNNKIPNFNFINLEDIDNYHSVSCLTRMNNPLLPMIKTDGTPETEGINGMFYYATKLKYIPENFFMYNHEATNFSDLFGRTFGSGLVIPENLFSLCTNMTNASGIFSYGGFRLESANSIFKNNLKLENLSNAFSDCTIYDDITNIFSDLINLKDLSWAFSKATIVSGTIPNLDNNIALENVSNMFATCSGLTIPEYYFRNNVNITDFSYCFNGCTFNSKNLIINRNIFCDEDTEMETRFAGKTVNFTSCFEQWDEDLPSTSDTAHTVGVAPQLWNYTFGNVTSDDCYSGGRNKKITNYYIIPETWGGPYKTNSMTFIIDTTKVSSTNVKFSLPFYANTYSSIGNLTINWGDGKTTSITNKTITDSNRAHTYSKPGVYEIMIISSNGAIPRIFSDYANPFDENRTNDCLQITRVETPLLLMYEGTDQYDPDISNKKITKLQYTFSRCKNLEYIFYGFLDKNSQITSINSIFSECNSLISLDYRWFKNTPNVTDVGGMFNKCLGIKDVPSNLFINLPNLETASSNFLGCTNLKNIGNELYKNTPKLTSLVSEFSGCTSLVEIPQDLFRYNPNLQDVESLFEGCTSLLTVPEYLFRYNLKLWNLGSLFSGCTNLTINRNIFCDEETEMETRFATGDIEAELSPATNGMTFVSAFEGISKGEAPQLWNYKYLVKVKNFYTGEDYTVDYADGNYCFSKNNYDGAGFKNNILNYPLIPEIWGGEYAPGTMTFTIDTTASGTSVNVFKLPFVEGLYPDIGTVTIDWGDTTYETRNIVVGDDLSGAKLAFNFPNNLYSSLPDGYQKDVIICGNEKDPSLNIYTGHSTWEGGGYEGSIYINTNRALINYDSDDNTLYSASSYSSEVTKKTNLNLTSTSTNILVTKIDTSNAAYQYIKLKVPTNNTIISDGVVNENVCTHTYSTGGVYTITIKSSNGKIPKMGGYSLEGTEKISSLRDTILQMVKTDGTNIIDISALFANSKLTSIPSSLFYYNRHIKNVSELFRNTQIAEIPIGFFDYLPKLENVSYCFNSCSKITNIPKGLFDKNNMINSFSNCFYHCNLIPSIPGELFIHNVLATDFSSCFEGCSGLTSIGTDLFCDEKEDKDTRFANAEIDFSSCFANAGASTNTVLLPDLWNYTYYLVNSKNCFSEFNGTPVNWDEVPVGWGGNKKTFTLNISIPSDDLSFIVPFKPGTYSYSGGVQIDWGDNSTTTINSPITQEQCSHTYNSSGLYSITLNVLGDMMPLFSFGNTSPTNASKLLSVEGTLGRMSNTDNDIIENLEGEQINVANFDYMFSGCSNLTKVSSSLLQLNDGDQINDVYPNAVRMFEDSGIESLIENFFPALGEDVNACFYNCTNLIKIPQLIGASNYNSCFYGCTSLVDIPYDTFAWRGQGNSKSKTFNFCFSNCISLKSIPDRLFLFLDEEGVDEFTGCFSNCINLETIPDGLFENTTAVDYSGCFSNCDKLKINPNIFGSSVDRFSKLKDNQTVDLSSMFALTNSFKGTSRGTAPELWNYIYAPTNYVNIFQQENDKSETKSGVDVTYNVDSSILINGSASAQADFISETFTFNINPSKWYNFTLEKNNGSVTQTSTYLLKLTLTNSAGVEYYSKIFSTIDDLGKWEGLSFVASSSSTFQLTIRVYGGNAYDNLSITPKLSLARVTFSQCFKGQTTNSLLNYNNIPSSWK